MNDLELIDEIVKRAEEHQKQREKDFAIEELKKIKYKFACTEWNNTGDGMYAEKILDNRIKELKGENNELL